MPGSNPPRAWVQGRLVRVTWDRPGFLAPSKPPRGNPAPEKRRAVRGFSHASRRRLRRAVARVGWRPALFITLTPSPDWPERADPKRMKYRLFRYIREYVVPSLPKSHAIFWKMEFTKRGWVHFHLLIFARQRLAWFDQAEAQQAWGAHVWVEFADAARVGWYVAKYTTKPTRTPGGGSLDLGFIPEKAPGRFWGLWNRRGYEKLLEPVRVVGSWVLGHPEVDAFIKWMKKNGYSFWVFTLDISRPWAYNKGSTAHKEVSHGGVSCSSWDEGHGHPKG